MRIVSWNCQGAYRKKQGLLDRWHPDVSVLAEVSREDLVQPDLIADSGGQFWRQCPGGKSLGVIRRGHVRIHGIDGFESWPEGVLPVTVETPIPMTIIAIWTQMTKGKENVRYVRALHVMLDQYSDLLRSRPALLIGDFNSNTQWDAEHKGQSHSELVARLSDLGIVSLHHARTGEQHGKETVPTFFLYRNRHKPFHIDFCFLSRDLLDQVTSFEIGTPDEWLPHSDHMPLFVEFATLRA